MAYKLPDRVSGRDLSQKERETYYNRRNEQRIAIINNWIHVMFLMRAKQKTTEKKHQAQQRLDLIYRGRSLVSNLNNHKVSTSRAKANQDMDSWLLDVIQKHSKEEVLILIREEMLAPPSPDKWDYLSYEPEEVLEILFNFSPGSL